MIHPGPLLLGFLDLLAFNFAICLASGGHVFVSSEDYKGTAEMMIQMFFGVILWLVQRKSKEGWLLFCTTFLSVKNICAFLSSMTCLKLTKAD